MGLNPNLYVAIEIMGPQRFPGVAVQVAAGCFCDQSAAAPYAPDANDPANHGIAAHEQSEL
jgi:hypothetical protein